MLLQLKNGTMFPATEKCVTMTVKEQKKAAADFAAKCTDKGYEKGEIVSTLFEMYAALTAQEKEA